MHSSLRSLDTLAAPVGPTTVTEHAVEQRDGVVIRDLGYAGPDGEPVRAHLVEPAVHGRYPATLYLHWFEPGNATSSRLEFLDEAVALARRGMIALLPDLTYPWKVAPTGGAGDLDRVVGQLTAVRRGLDLLAGRGDGGLAVVGHDYGGMYGLLAAAADRDRVWAVVAMNVDATFGNWFAQFFLEIRGGEAVEYAERFEPVDPIGAVDALAMPVLFQFSEPDFYVPDSTRRALVSRTAAPKECRLYPGAPHALDEQARADRMRWLADQLGL